MKKYIATTIAAAVFLVLLIAGVIFVLNIDKVFPEAGRYLANKNGTSDDGSNSGSSESLYRKLIQFESSSVAAIESYFDGTKLTLRRITEKDEKGKETKTWICTSDSAIEANNSNVSSLLSSIMTSCSGTIIKDRDVLSEYGFDEEGKSDMYFRIANYEGAVTTIYIGFYDYSREYRYVCVDDGTLQVYRLNIYSADRMLFKKKAITLVKAFPFLTTDIPSKLTIYEEGEKAIALDCTGVDRQSTETQKRVVGYWRVRFPIERKSQESAVNNLVKDLNGVTLDGVAAAGVTEEQLADYGLAPAAIEYYLDMINADNTIDSYVLKVGNKNEDGNAYYCLIGDAEDGLYDVFTVNTGYVYHSINVLNYVDPYLYLEDSDLISSIDIDIKGEEKHKMVYTYETVQKTNSAGYVETEEVVTRYFDGKEAPDDDNYAVVANDNRYTRVTEDDIKFNRDDDLTNDITTINPYEGFNRVLLALYVNFAIKDIDLDEPAADQLGEKLATITYTERDGDVFKIEVYQKEDNRAWAYINGKYAGGCIKTTGIFREEYMLYDVMAAIKCQKIVMALVP